MFVYKMDTSQIIIQRNTYVQQMKDQWHQNDNISNEAIKTRVDSDMIRKWRADSKFWNQPH